MDSSASRSILSWIVERFYYYSFSVCKSIDYLWFDDLMADLLISMFEFFSKNQFRHPWFLSIWLCCYTRYHNFPVLWLESFRMWVCLIVVFYFLTSLKRRFVLIFVFRIIWFFISSSKFICSLFSDWTTIFDSFILAVSSFKNYNIWIWFPFFIWIKFVVLNCEFYISMYFNLSSFRKPNPEFFCFHHTRRKRLFRFWRPIFVSSL